MCIFLVDGFAAFWLPCIVSTLCQKTWRTFPGSRGENPKIFLLAPSALADYELTFGRCVPKTCTFLVDGFVAFWLPCMVCTLFQEICDIFPGSRCENSKIFLLAPSALADYELPLGRCALKSCAFSVDEFGAFWLSCIGCILFQEIWSISPGFRCENPKVFLLAPSALADYDLAVGRDARREGALF